MLVIVDTGYDVPRLAYLLAGLIELLGRLSDRVMEPPLPARRPGWPRKRRHQIALADSATWALRRSSRMW